MAYTLPQDVDQRPVAVVGAGTLGRLIATVFAAGGSDVRLFDTSAEQLEAGRDHVEQHAAEVGEALDVHPDRTGGVEAVDDLARAADRAWLIIESVPERVDLKVKVFGELDRLAADDAVLATNSSSLPSRLVIDEVQRPERVLNMHFQQPPQLNAVELMTCGETDPAVIDALMERLPQFGLAPFHVRVESDGFIFNRIWAAIKRECLMVVEEGVATPEDVDEMWRIFTRPGIPPFRLMDRVGLDVVLAIEEHYAEVRDGIPESPRALLRHMVDEGRLGTKSGGGFYDDAG